MTQPNFYEQVYKVVRQIPPGKVTSYGRIAKMLGAPRAARAVGYALRALKDKQGDAAYAGIPWHRVINSQGRISIQNREAGGEEQAKRLRAEGIVLDDQYRLHLDTYLWQGLHWLEIDDIHQG
jgi:methylated-DNA-protein-cysteine methyltransferase-like protein